MNNNLSYCFGITSNWGRKWKDSLQKKKSDNNILTLTCQIPLKKYCLFFMCQILVTEIKMRGQTS